MRGAAAKSLFAVLTILAGSSLAFGQAGSVGGVIGKTDKSVSGEEAAPRKIHSARRSSAKADSRSHARRSEPSAAGGLARFDGTWTGDMSPPCAGSGIRTLRVSGGHITGIMLTGPVSASGSFRFQGQDGTVGTGQVSGNTASGSYRQPSGCSGTLTATKN
jgi:hypothetical protein